ncbi:Sarcosine oxidase subunit beta [Roseovarius litorisediminis]|uniref:Sarcosine oxidase subunit beta n=1 Tax=Roseovarius litorisediminis TaxID=1312363 RepID=A0A1Y5TTD1_9RHOB|nr:FAD-binding oxidoreductase [Roseovarius litorisediminis]SLN67609.1 Sarcosine oxidase subunit beta [Roseovarius litorisediminis]
MNPLLKQQPPTKDRYDVVIVGGAMMGASTAWFLTDTPDFDGSVLVVERDPSYEFCSTAHSNSCIRQQFSTEINVRISQFGADFINNLPRHMGNDPRVPQLRIQNYGYLYLADNDAFADILRDNQKVQHAAGAGTRLLSPEQIKEAYPFYNVDDVVLGSLNTVDEGYWDSIAVFDWWRRQSRERGVEYVANEVVTMAKNAAGTRVETVTLASGEVISCGQVVNCSGPRAARTSRMAGIDIPVEPRKRYTWVFSAEKPLDRELPLTVDPSGVHMRQDGKTTYMAGGHSEVDPAVDYDDFNMDLSLWENHVWPAIATRIPQFEAIKVMREWTGHYAYNTFDHNAIIGPHDTIENFIFLNGFSGHGLQQAPAMGRGTAEWLTYGEYRSLDLTPFHYDRILRNAPLVEKAII